MRVLTHNVYWFQGNPPVWGTEQVKAAPEIVEQLAKLYRDARADVMCLQEVHSDDPCRRIAERLGVSTLLRVPGGSRPEYGGAVLPRGDVELRDLTRSERFVHERIHMRARVRWNGTPLEIAVLHLPSNRYAPDPAAAERARIAELDRVFSASPNPLIVLGDLNSTPDAELYRYMLLRGFVDAATASGAAERPNRIDYIWLHETIADRLVAYEVLDSGLFRRTQPDGSVRALSDHPPLLVELAE